MAKIVIVAESYGRHEEMFRHPLVWTTGHLLAEMMYEAGLSDPIRSYRPSETDMIAHWRKVRTENDIFLTNVFNIHPLNDQTELLFDSKAESDLPPFRIGPRALRLKPEFRNHITRLYSELDFHKPNLIIALGNYACWALLGQTKITAIRGTVKLGYNNYKILPTFHPAAAVPSRDVSIRPQIVADLTKAKRESAFPEIRRIKRWITCENPTSKEKITINEIEAWFRKPSLSYSIDIESGYALFSSAEIKSMPLKMKRILSSLVSMISFARSNTDAIVIPFMTRENIELNYFPFEEELKAWKITQHELESPIPKTFQNGLYDITMLLRLGLIVNNATDDTMILMHSLMPESPKSLGFMGSLFSDEISWKQMRSGGESIKREE